MSLEKHIGTLNRNFLIYKFILNYYGLNYKEDFDYNYYKEKFEFDNFLNDGKIIDWDYILENKHNFKYSKDNVFTNPAQYHIDDK